MTTLQDRSSARQPRTPSTHLLDGDPAGLDRYREAVAAGADLVATTLAGATRPTTGASPADLAGPLAAVDLDAPLGDTTAALAEVERLYLRDAVYFHHPTYLAHLNCPVVVPAVLGETLVAAVNSSLDTWDQSAGGTLIERALVDWTAARAGLPATADGVFTSGGTQSNLQAMLLAREEACARLRRATPGARLPELLGRLRILTSRVSHFSVTTSATLLGLGADAVVAVDVDADQRMRPDALASAIGRCARDGEVVMAVVATAGTTDFGSIDPLPEVAEIAAAAGAWLHVDAAYGGGLLASRRRRHLLDGIERADSVTVDFHKTWFQPVSSSALLVRDGAALAHTTHHADYLNPDPASSDDVLDLPNQVDKSLQTTRRFDALKLWLTLRVMGADAVGELFDAVIDTAAAAHGVLAGDPRWEVVVRPALSTLVFRPRPRPGVDTDALVRRLRTAVNAQGRAVLGGTTVEGAAHLKLTLLNPATTTEHVEGVLALVHEHAEEIAAQLAGEQAGAATAVASAAGRAA